MNKILLHIPHSSKELPSEFYNNELLISKDELNDFINNITDNKTDKLFEVDGITSIKAKYSRVYCDVEKFSDDNIEEMSKVGMGMVYTHTNKGIKFINYNKEYKEDILNNYYIPYHNNLDEVTSKLLKESDNLIIIDCHSFSKEIIMFEDRKDNIPDICIGYNNEQDKTIALIIKDYFDKLNYKTSFNYPYTGSLIPNKFYNNQPSNLYSFMIELNKDIYLKEEDFNKLRNEILNLYKMLQNTLI